MIRSILAVIRFVGFSAALVASVPADGEVITPGMALESSEWFGQPAFRIAHLRPDGGGSGLYVQLGPSGAQVRITPVGETPAWPTSWYQAAYQLPFDGPAVESMTPFANNWGDPESAITVDALTTFYIASWAGNDYAAGQPIIGPEDYYVWGQFVVNTVGGQSSLSLVDSAITKVGIYVGTNVAVPEPSVAGFGLVAAGMLVVRRWTPRRGPRRRSRSRV